MVTASFGLVHNKDPMNNYNATNAICTFKATFEFQKSIQICSTTNKVRMNGRYFHLKNSPSNSRVFATYTQFQNKNEKYFCILEIALQHFKNFVIHYFLGCSYSLAIWKFTCVAYFSYMYIMLYHNYVHLTLALEFKMIFFPRVQSPHFNELAISSSYDKV